MVCVYCRQETKVINSRLQRRSNQVWRRRKCLSCSNVFTSIERPALAGSLLVQKTQNHVEPFSREKLLIDVYNSCRHRKTAVSDATGLTETIVGVLQKRIVAATLSREDIITVSAGVLKRFDRAAYVQYLAYHPPKPPS